MAKTKESKKRKQHASEAKFNGVVVNESFNKLPILFPEVEVTRYFDQSRLHKNRNITNIIIDIKLPKDYILVSRTVSTTTGEITKISFKTSKKSGVYIFSLDAPLVSDAV